MRALNSSQTSCRARAQAGSIWGPDCAGGINTIMAALNVQSGGIMVTKLISEFYT